MNVAHSCLYVGHVRHCRNFPRKHEFSYKLFLVGLDLDSIEKAMEESFLLGFERRAHSSFFRSDYFGDSSVSIISAVRDKVELETGFRPDGPIELVTQLRTFGFSFNPVTFYYCWNPSRTSLQAILVEITNTPWGERHSYVLDCVAGSRGEGRHRWEFPKEFHISPFSRMELLHDWRFSEPGDRISVVMANRTESSSAEFVAKLSLEKRPLDAREVRRALWRHPWPPVQAMVGIYWNAFRLWWKGATFHSHPVHRDAEQQSREAA